MNPFNFDPSKSIICSLVESALVGIGPLEFFAILSLQGENKHFPTPIYLILRSVFVSILPSFVFGTSRSSLSNRFQYVELTAS